MAVERVVVTSREPFREAQGLGLSYDIVRGSAYFVLDPKARANSRIVDLELAASDDGLVHFSSDLLVLEPAGSPDPAPLLYVVANRGRAESVPLSLTAPDDALGEAGSITAGDAFLLRAGYRIAWCGWQGDLASSPGLLRLNAPLATEGGEVPAGFMEIRIEPGVARDSFPLIDSRNSPLAVVSYPTRSLEDPSASLLVRPRDGRAFVTLERRRWCFAKATASGLVPSSTDIALTGGFQPESVYLLRYRPDRCPVNGVGLTVARDFVSLLRHDPAAMLGPTACPISSALAFGVSQSGRYLRQFLFEGLNIDEHGRTVFDGVLAHIAGARRGEFNLRFGQLSVNRGDGAGLLPPYPAAHRSGGLLDRQRELGGVPQLMLVNSASEYWRRDGGALHIEADGSKDLPEEANVRCYLIAGTSHVLGNPTSALPGPANPPSVLDPKPVLRALIVALERWVSTGLEPPASRVPRRSDGSAVEREEVLADLARIPGLSLPAPEMLPATSRSHPGEEEVRDSGAVRDDDRLVSLVSAVDRDGNETAGVILPELAAPLFTHSGINPRRRPAAEPAELFDLVGTSLPFARSAPARRTARDPRLAIEERYSTRTAYLDEVRVAAAALASSRLLLVADVEATLTRAAQHYDALLSAWD